MPIQFSIAFDLTIQDLTCGLTKCRKEHRDCWTLEVEGAIAGVAIRKEETHAEAGTQGVGPKILKLCTFKVRDEFQGEKFGELLLKQIIWFSQRNNFNLIYVTTFPKHAALLELLAYYGFKRTKKYKDRRMVVGKGTGHRSASLRYWQHN